MSVKLGYEAIEFSIRKWMTKNTKGIATIPGQKMKDKIKILVDKYADQFRIKGQDINTVTVKQVDNAIDYGMTLKKQKVKKAQEQYDKAKKEYDYLTSEKGLEAEYEKLIKKSPEELRDMMRKQGITPVEDKGITSLGKKKYPPFNTSKEDFTKGWTPEVISKEFPLTKDASFRIKQGLSTQIKLNNLGANKQLAKELIGGKNAEFNSLNKIGKKEILDRLDTNIKNAKAEFATPVEPDDLASGGIARVGMAGGGAMWKLVKEFIEKLFIKSSNDIRLGRGKWAGLTQEQWITQHDNLTKMLKKWEHGGKKRLPEGAEQYLGMNDLQIARAVKEAEKKVKKGDLSKYTDEDLNALVAEDKKILAEANKLSEAGTNYGRVSEIEARRKEIKEILEAAQAVPESGYGNIKADLALQKQVSKTKKPKVKDEYYSEKDRNKITKALGTGEDLSNVSSAYAKKYVDQLLTDWKPGKGKKGHASGGIAGQLHLNRPGYAGGAIVKGGAWFLKQLRLALDEMIFGGGKFANLPEAQKVKLFKETEAMIKYIEGGGKIPDEIIQTMKKDPKFKLLDKTTRSKDKDLAEMEDLVFGETKLSEKFPPEMRKYMGRPLKEKDFVEIEALDEKTELFAFMNELPKELQHKVGRLPVDQQLPLLRKFKQAFETAKKGGVESGADVLEKQLLEDFIPKGKPHAAGGIAGQLHLNEGGRARYQHGSRQPGLETSTSRAKQEAQQREIRGIQQAMVDRGGGDAQAYIDEHERIQRRNVGIEQIINKTITDNKIIQDKKRMDIRRQQKDWKRKDNLAWKMFKKTSDQLTDEEEDAINAQILNQDFERFESDLPGKIFKKPPVLLDQSGESDEEQVATMNAITMGKKFLGMNAELTTLFPNRKTGTVGELEKFIDESAVIGSLDMNDVVRFQSIIDSTKNSMMITSNTPIASVAHFVDTGETEVGTGMNIGDISVGADLRFHDGEYVTDDSTINVALPFAKEKRTIRSMTSEGPRKYDPLSPLTYSGKIGAQNLEDFVGEAGINYNISDDLSAGLKTEYLPDDQKNLVANIDYNKAIGPFNITSGLTYNVLDPNLNLDVGVQYDFADDGTLKAGGVFDQSGPNYGITYKRPLRKKPKILGKYAKGGLAKILGV